MSLTKKNITQATIFTGLVWFIVVFLIAPNITTVTDVFWQDGEFTMRAIERMRNAPRAMQALRNSFIIAPVLSVTVGFVGVTLVLITDYFKVFGAKILRLGYMTTLLYSGIVLVSGYVFLYGNNGFVTNILVQIFPNLEQDWFSGFWAVLFVMTFAATGNHMIFIRNALRSVDYQTIEVARNLGASSFTILWRVVLPVLLPSLTAVTVFTFLGGLSAIAAPLLVGGPDFRAITPLILQLSRLQGSRDIAALLALILGVSSILLIAVFSLLEKRGHYLSVSKVKTDLVKQKIRNPVVNVFVHIYAYVLFLIYISPVVMIVLFSFTDSRTIARREFNFSALTLDNYIAALTQNFSPFMTSAIYSFLAATGVAVLMLLVCRIITKHKGKASTAIEYAFMIPWLLPTVLIAWGLVATFNRPQWFMFNQPLANTTTIMVLGYLIICIPFTLRMTRASFFSIDDTLEDAAKNLGAKPMYAFLRIIIPVILPSVLAIFALNFNRLLAEFDMSVFMYNPLSVPLGVEIENLTMAGDSGGDSAELVFVYTVIIMAISALVLYLVYGRNSKIGID
ncbi:MAG: iron ABC transporter permease [Defluviitaleaceae bacterium]|nr:iron ABC transporter permease [Defluviitaleaceae bacterium]